MATLILQDTYTALQDEIKSLDKLRTETALKIQEAASHGDLKENYEYKAAKEEMKSVTGGLPLPPVWNYPFESCKIRQLNV